MKRVLVAMVTSIVALLGLAASAMADVPNKMNFSGTYSSGSVTLDFYFSSGTISSSQRLPTDSVWHEQLSTTTTDGLIEYMLGSQMAIPQSIFVDSSTTRYLEIVEDGVSTFIEQVSVSYAYKASVANELLFDGDAVITARDKSLVIQTSGTVTDYHLTLRTDNGDVYVQPGSGHSAYFSNKRTFFTGNDNKIEFANGPATIYSIGDSSITINAGNGDLYLNNTSDGDIYIGSDDNNTTNIDGEFLNINTSGGIVLGYSMGSTYLRDQSIRFAIIDSTAHLTIDGNGYTTSTNKLYLDLCYDTSLVHAKRYVRMGSPNGLTTVESDLQVRKNLTDTNGTARLTLGSTSTVSGALNVNGEILKNGVPFSGSDIWDNVTGGINYASGNVGIGSTAPVSALEVNGSITASGTISASTVTVSGTITIASTVTAGGIVVPNGGITFGIIPTGTILPYISTVAPAGFLYCNGQSYTQTEYPALYTLLNGTGGNFNVPDMRGMFMRGYDDHYGVDPDSTTRTIGSTQTDTFASHSHDFYYKNDVGLNTAGGETPFANKLYGDLGTASGDYSPVKVAGGTETRPKNIAVTYIIKY